jgi:hypothetical protein
MSGSWKQWEFPNLKESDHKKTSEASDDYNCIAWAAFDDTKRWDPDEMEQHYWPPSIPRVINLEVFKEVFRRLNFEDCDDATFENGIEKIAIYATSDGQPTHIARQVDNGIWTSKLGYWEDIEHYNLECLGGEKRDYFGRIMLYGKPVSYMKRIRVIPQKAE